MRFFLYNSSIGNRSEEVKIPALSLHRTQRQGRGNRAYDDSEKLGQLPVVHKEKCQLHLSMPMQVRLSRFMEAALGL
jgi:hypothetical protein